ncbi:MAG TPA: hypothetical protein PLF92_03935 [Arenimonas sp.]|nr:hypothetical protein [Arenimonas sp.]HPW32037.1 hypothetical protein [Arenimonas sp.]
MTTLYLKPDGSKLADLIDNDLLCMQNVMEEESSTDRDYFIDLSTVDMLKNAGATEGLLDALTKAIGESEGIDVEWK